MLRQIINYLFFGLLISSCTNIFEKEHRISDKYFVSKDPAGNFYSLDYNLSDGNAILRVANVKRAGEIKGFIIVETEYNEFYIFNSKKDSIYYNSPDIIGNPKTNREYLKFLDSLKVDDFEFKFSLDK
ncbi:hypothetical protein AHMF7605_07245 [Adhaeribacter arboris]|uniref:DUF3997 domain-containing protein n=1 Tax=Adhaeribacter arboris TaxID=2072846 RepID=A0A2T2YCU8_9BACT|nr:hypothetical protein [Adhaeribacter arboris]PSR53337.1 hypothetical protein AHMF7605_07245 [Adhaeribacter arboris]